MSTLRSRPANPGARAASTRALKHTVIALTIATLLGANAHAQEASTGEDKEKKEVTDLDKVQVTGIRASVYRAQDIKRDAETFVDSVTAQDIGALPDRSVTETLSRIPGVTIDHFLSVGDPEHFSAEGNGVQVRGLTQVRSELNGRDSFSASGGRSLSFQDVPSELMSGVDVYKNQKADMIEGGLGGSVDLRTFMPFDFKDSKFAVSMSANKGDFAKKLEPSGSVLYSNRWNTDAGEFGVLVDIAHSGLATRTDGMFLRPFFETRNTDLNGDGVKNETLWLPRGADWRTLTYDRERQGGYLALQWRPRAGLEFYATGFQSRYDELWYEDAIFVGNDPTQVALDASQPYELDGNVFRSGRLVQTGDIPMGTDIRASHRKSKTTDFSVGMKWQFSDATDFSTDFQYIKATTKGLDSTVSLGVNVPYIDVDLGGGLPSIGVDPQFTTNPANYYWGFTMDHRDDNLGKELAWRADLKHSFDSGFIKSFKVGVRATDRDATNVNTGYDWQPVFQTWMQWWALPGNEPLPGLDLSSTVNTSLTHLNQFSNFYQGKANTPGQFYAPILATALGFPVSYQDIHAAAAPYYNCCYGAITPRKLTDPQWRNVQGERTYAAYAMLNFGVDDMRLDGNVGVRVIRTENEANGFVVWPNTSTAPYLGHGQSEPIAAQNSYTDVLPSANIKWELADNLILRFAASKAIARPSFNELQAYQTLSVAVNQDHVVGGVACRDIQNGGTPNDPSDDPTVLPAGCMDLTSDVYGNPHLTPMKANQFDLSLEWYFNPEHGGMAWINLFRKDLKDYFRRQARFETYKGDDGNDYEYLVTRPVNTGTAKIQGAEIGWNQFFDFLPGPLNGLGMSANYTYIDSSTNVPNDPSVVPRDTDGSSYGKLPADGLSKNSYNVAVFYEKGPWQVRFAYNWRSEFLLSVGANGYNGTNNNLDQESIAWKLPVYSDAYGQLDGSIFYRFSDNVQIGLEMNNLNNAEQRTIMKQNGAGSHVTSWYVNDRRYAATLRFTF
ncbi:MAG TPA: TonB-dependent receptor [Pseudoxanthomonas sp.]|uniref:TonB-dependent receptor n=1 Tax=Pseudoxanthomonas helianthi TaxID=1453541 RepID=A0A940X1N8_9GAMM|nr:TonB-dependent receptor [Pseudoxanthomonas helianthi]MBP3983426.1 TonB-dependent receptor [Pseudoxanthomonas helianthi]HWU69868.1 TonB-dependent receptor [Pseudoxanthomonas sp.]